MTPHDARQLDKVFRDALVEFLVTVFDATKMVDEASGYVEGDQAFQFLKTRVALSDSELVDIVNRAENEWYSR